MLTSTDDIDALLEKYLHLLDEYTKAREQLTKLQASVQLDLSRANFSAERGIRYGQDYYDERMQASRRVQIETEVESEPIPSPISTIPRISIASTLSIPPPNNPASEDPTPEPASASKESTDTNAPTPSEGEPLTPAQLDTQVPDPTSDSDSNANADDAAAPAPQTLNTKDPIRWFGIIAPTALRSAQQTSIALVVEAVPRVVALDARLRELEIGIRRARKYHAKEVREREKVEKAGGEVGVEVGIES